MQASVMEKAGGLGEEKEEMGANNANKRTEKREICRQTRQNHSRRLPGQNTVLTLGRMGTTTVSDRRQALSTLAVGGLTVALGPLFSAACGSQAHSTDEPSQASDSETTDANTSAPQTSDTTTNSAGAGAIDASKWATGGTAAMVATASYPDPFSDAAATSCAATCQATAGPCYLADGPPESRQDITEGQNGLPMRTVLRILDTTCQPIEGAVVELWHCNAAGVYSGKTPNEQFCSNSDAAAIAAEWFRGVGSTDANGVVTFDSCFPGWYTSRTIHVHFRVAIGGTDMLTTQFVFPDDVTDAIIASQPLYKDRGARDTTNENDTVVGADAATAYSFDVAQMTDGAMLASKTMVVRTSTSASLCTIPGGTAGGTGASPSAPGGPMPGQRLARPKER